jgi:hypothetical protein
MFLSSQPAHRMHVRAAQSAMLTIKVKPARIGATPSLAACLTAPDVMFVRRASSGATSSPVASKHAPLATT